MAKLKVFRGTTFSYRVGGETGQRDCIMATTSQKKFMDATNGTRGFFGVTGNAESIRVAMKDPETVFVNKNGTNWPNVWVRPDTKE